MASPPQNPVAARPSWTEVLDSIQQALDQALVQVGDPASLIDPSVGAGEPATDWQPVLQRMEERLQQLQAMAQRAEQSVAEADALLAAGAGALAQWQAAARRTLAEGGALSVK